MVGQVETVGPRVALIDAPRRSPVTVRVTVRELARPASDYRHSASPLRVTVVTVMTVVTAKP
jgi:hypothetical protein